MLVPEIRHLSYENRLKELKLQSAQRRYERYDILYIRKVMMGLVPNCGITIRRCYNVRNGVTLDIPNMKGISKLRMDSFCIRGPKLFNCLPESLRNMTSSMDTFKEKLDQYLSLLPYRPRIDEGSKLHCKCLDHVIFQWKWMLRCQPLTSHSNSSIYWYMFNLQVVAQPPTF